jgi:tetratricopeptide (TPR) repeat protein
MLARSRLAHWWSLGAVAMLLACAGLVALGLVRPYWVPGVAGAWVAAGYFLDRVFLYSLAGAYQELLCKDAKQAAAWYRKAVDAGSTDPQVRARLGHYALVEGDYQEAARLLQDALAQLPHHVHARMDLTLALLKLGKRSEAQREAGRTARLQASCPAAWVVHGMAQKDAGDHGAALESTARALQLDPGMALGHSNLGEILYAMKRPEEAKRHLQQAVTLAPDVPDGHYWLAAIYSDEGNASQARLELAEALNRLDPQDSLSNVTRQVVLKRLARLSPLV